MTPSLRVVGEPAPVPSRPRMRRDRALAWRSPTTLQVGTDPGGALVVDGLDPAAAALVAGLDGSRRVEDLLAEAVARGGDPRALRAVLDRLAAAGALAGADPSEPRLAAEVPAVAGDVPADGDRVLAPRTGSSVVVHGGGRTAVAVACLLAAAGVGIVVPRAAGPVTGGDTGTGLVASDVGRPRAEAVADALARAAPAVRVRAPVRRRPDVVVLAEGEVVDPVLARRLVAAGHPHLPVAVREGVGVVGPLVLPGRTACLCCLQGRRAAADPGWPRVAAQLVGREATAPVALASVTAALAVEQVLALLDAPAAAAGRVRAPAALGAALELDPRRARLWTRPAAADPRCGCGATGGATKVTPGGVVGARSA